MTKKPAFTNRLIDQTSPYLLQHAHNPVDWWPWCDQAFEVAKSQDKPIFLSIGYSTCHWCHVMEHESFEDQEVAEYLNQHFIAIKVDREERPDIDALYMQALQMASGHGGWPMSLMLDHKGRPFFLGTYFPPRERFGRPGFFSLLKKTQEFWQHDRERLMGHASLITKELRDVAHSQSGAEGSLPSTSVFDKAFERLSGRFDQVHGGFGSRLKFPTPHVYNFLLRYYARSGSEQARKMVTFSLEKIAMGGIHDHVGGGFHRYSTDQEWRLSHFEKMLYDQALLARAYLETYQMTQDTFFAEQARDIFRYVLRDLQNPEGGFFSAEDADSLDQEGNKEEGAFYVFGYQEIFDILGQEEAQIIVDLFDLREEGNYRDEASGQETGLNILHAKGRAQLKAFGIENPKDYQDKIKPLLEKLFTQRENRQRPGLDDKMLTSWNGLMLEALALGARVLKDQSLLQAAEKNANYVLSHLLSEEDQLFRSYCKGKRSDVKGFLDDYAFYANGLFELYQSTFKLDYLKASLRLCEKMLELFLDQENGAFFLSRQGEEELLVRHKDLYDGAEPSGNSVAAEILLKLGRLLGRDDLLEHAERLFSHFSAQLQAQPDGHARALCALDFALASSQEVVLSCREQAQAKPFLDYLQSLNFFPHALAVLRTEENASELEELLPFTKNQSMIKEKVTAYICENHVCAQPVFELEAFQSALAREL